MAYNPNAVYVPKYQMQVNFVAPTALNTDTVFTDADTAATFYQPLLPNTIIDFKDLTDPAATINYVVFVRRQDNSRKRVGATGDFLTGFNGVIRPNMPRPLAPGWFQFLEQQTAGALTAQNYLVVFATPLAV